MEDTRSTNRMVLVIIISLLIGFGIGWFAASGRGAADPLNGTDEENTAGMEDGGAMMIGEDNGAMVAPSIIEGGLDVSLDPVPAPSVPAVGDFSLSVNDQAPGDRVVIARAVLAEASWVAIRETNEQGGVGNILGARWLPGGTHTDVSVNLLRGTTEGGINYATIFIDNGDKDFDHKIDTPVLSGNGSAYQVSFTTEAGAGPGLPL